MLRVRLNLAQAFMIQNKSAEAVKETNAIYPGFVAALGPEHELTMQLLTTRAQSEGSLGLWEDAIRDDMAIYNLAVKKQGPLSFFAIATLSDASLAKCRSARIAEGVTNSRKAYLQEVTPIFTRANAEPYQQRQLRRSARGSIQDAAVLSFARPPVEFGEGI